jgi:uncharacterized protein
MVVRKMASVWLFLLLNVAMTAMAQVEVPELKMRVTDRAGILSEWQRAILESKLEMFENQRGNQVLLLVVPSTHPETIEQFSMRVVEAWKPGRKNKDDGVLLVISKNDRTVRIEVGYGLEAVLSDVVAKRIIANTILPRFDAHDPSGGISDGVDRILQVIDTGQRHTKAYQPPPLTAVLQEYGGVIWFIGVLIFALLVHSLLSPPVAGFALGVFAAATFEFAAGDNWPKLYMLVAILVPVVYWLCCTLEHRFKDGWDRSSRWGENKGAEETPGPFAPGRAPTNSYNEAIKGGSGNFGGGGSSGESGSVGE